MKKFVNDFVSKYKVVLDMKKIYDFEHFRFPLLRTGVLVFLVIMAIFLVIGWLAGQLDSLHYAFLMINHALFGGFCVPLLNRELRFKRIRKIEYETMVAIGFDLIRLIAIITTINSIVLFLIFGQVVSIILVILLAIISIVSLVLEISLSKDILAVENESKYANIVPRRQNLSLLIVAMTTFDIILLYELDFHTIVIAYVLPVLILTVIYPLLSRLTANFKMAFKNTRLLLFSFLVLFVFYVFRSFPDYMVQAASTNFIYIDTVPFYQDVLDDIDINNVFIHGDSYFAESEGVLYEYDTSMQLIDSIDPNLDNVRYFFFVGDKLKVLVEDPETDSNYYTFYGIIYGIENPLHPIEEASGLFFDYAREGYETKVIYYEDAIINFEGDASSEFTCLSGSFALETGNLILYQTDEEVIFIKDGLFYQYVSFKNVFSSPDSYRFYSNDKLIIVYQDDSYIVDLEDYLFGDFDYDHEIDLNVGVIDSFLYDGDNYIFGTQNGIRVYNTALELVDSVAIGEKVMLSEAMYLVGFSGIENQYFPYFDFLSSEVTESYQIKTIDPDLFQQDVVSGRIDFISPWISIILGSCLVIVPFIIAKGRGELNG